MKPSYLSAGHRRARHFFRGWFTPTVTIDSHYWRKIASPLSFPKDPNHTRIVDLHELLRTRRLMAYLPETIFTLEAIPKNDRAKFFTDYVRSIRLQERFIRHAGDTTHVRTVIGPSQTVAARNSEVLKRHLHDALQVGFKLLHCPRISGTRNADVPKSAYVEQSTRRTSKRLNCQGFVTHDIESRGAGMAQAKALGARYAGGATWLEGLRNVPMDNQHLVHKAIAEWADGDAVAAHIAYGIDYFCTEDSAVKSGLSSVFSGPNRAYLSATYGVRFVTLAALHELLTT